MTRTVSEHDRQIGNLLEIGTVVSVTAEPPRARVKVGAIEIPAAFIGQLRAGQMSFWWMPEEGEQVLVAMLGGEATDSAVILASIFQGNAPSADPAVPMIELGEGGVMKINGTLEVSEDVKAKGISLVNHVHGGVKPGASNTDVPSGNR